MSISVSIYRTVKLWQHGNSLDFLKLCDLLLDVVAQKSLGD